MTKNNKKLMGTVAAGFAFITLIGFAISFASLQRSAYGVFSEYFGFSWVSAALSIMWPLLLDFSILVCEIALFYAVLNSKPYQKFMVRAIVLLVVGTVCLNIEHGLPAAAPDSFLGWVSFAKSMLIWVMAPIGQCLGAIVLSKIFHDEIETHEIVSSIAAVRTSQKVSPRDSVVKLSPKELRQIEVTRLWNEEKVHDKKQLARMLGVSEGTIYTDCKALALETPGETEATPGPMGFAEILGLRNTA